MATFTVIVVASLASVAAAAESPHGDYSPDPNLGKCGTCHTPHQAATSRGLLSVDSTSTIVTQTLFCFKCHADAGPAASNAAATFESGFLSGHLVEDVAEDESPDLTNTCSGCHDPHSSAPGLPRAEINGQEVSRTAEPNSWCLACHTPELATNWSGSVGNGYYDLLYELSSRDANGYPMTGTFRGAAAYAASAHASIPASDSVVIQAAPERTAARVEGDCLWCHASHRGVSEYDNLLGTFGPSAPGDPGADACFGCHDPDDPDPDKGEYGTGHFISSAGSVLQAGSPLPCYECHNAHGSKNGNTLLIQDSLGSNLDPGTPAGQSAFCYSCHLSSDGFWWDSASGTMSDASLASAPDSVTKVVAGIPREDMIALPSSIAQHESTTLEGCNCHGSAHSPNPDGVSAGGQSCYDCHGTLRPEMEWDASAPAAFGHSVGKDGRRGDTAAYPDYITEDTTDTVYCLSCHVDHDEFNADKGANLRTSIDGVVAVRTDHTAGTSNGICVSCHSVDVGGLGYTVDGADYAGGAHDYAISNAAIVGYDTTSAFWPNCTKCHTDPDGLDGRQDGTFKIAPHFSDTESRIARALGASVVSGSASTEENLCFACHDEGSAGNDGYGYKAMGSAARNVEWYFTTTTAGYSVNRHGVVGYAGEHQADEDQVHISANQHVECEDCHNPHTLGNAALNSRSRTRGTNAIEAGSPIAGTSGVTAVYTGGEWSAPTYASGEATREYEICFKCHSGANTALTDTGSDWYNAAWTNVALEFNPSNDSYHPIYAALPVSDAGVNNGSSRLLNDSRVGNQWTAGRGQTMYCSDCHGDSATTPRAQGPHGSARPYILKGRWPNKADGTPYYLSSTDSDLLCVRCHPNLNATGAGSLTLTNSVHRASHRSLVRGECTNCHLLIPHGGKVSRLIVDADSSTMPDRYRAANAAIRSFTKRADSSAYQQSDCQVSCTNHASAATENWD